VPRRKPGDAPEKSDGFDEFVNGRRQRLRRNCNGVTGNGVTGAGA